MIAGGRRSRSSDGKATICLSTDWDAWSVSCVSCENSSSRAIASLSVSADCRSCSTGMGKTKNAQFDRLFNLLLGEAAAKTPIELVLVSGERRLPQRFRSPAGLPLLRDGKAEECYPLTELRPSPLSVQEEFALAQRRLRIATTRDNDHPLAAKPARKFALHHGYFHFLAPTRTSIMLTTYFPSVALIIALDAGLNSLEKSEAETLGLALSQEDRLHQVPLVQFERRLAETIRALVMDVLNGNEETQPATDPQRLKEPKHLLPRILAIAGAWAAKKELWHQKLFAEGPKAPLLAAHPATEHSQDDAEKALSEIVDRIDARLRDLFEACAGSRYGFTVLMATAYQFLVGGRQSQSAGSSRARCGNQKLREIPE